LIQTRQDSFSILNIQTFFSKDCGGTTREAKMSQGYGFDIMKKAKGQLLITSFQADNEMNCVADCGIDCDCFLFIFKQKQCHLYRQEAQYYFNSSSCDVGTLWFKKSYLVDGVLYIANGKLLSLLKN